LASGVTTFCQGLNVNLSASAGTSWLWSNGATTQSIIVSNTGNFSVTVNNAVGCSKTSIATAVTVNPNPSAVITANGATTFCQGGNVMLTANTGSSYLWSNGATSQSVTVPSSGIFTVAVTQAGACISNSSNTTVTVNPTPVASIAASGATAFCQGGNVVLTATAGNSWLWSNGATSQSITASNSGNYAVTVSSTAGCSALSTSTVVAVSANPSVSLSANPYTKLYPGLTTSLTATVLPAGNYTYTWLKDGNVISTATTSILAGIDLNNLGSYEVKVANATGLACAKTSSSLLISDSVTSKMYIFPSPNNGQFSVAYNSNGITATNQKISMVIYDSKGAKVYTKTYTINTPYQLMDVDIRKYSKGVYQVVILDANNKKLSNGSVMLMK
jgi:Secretion system C-terminal sorting domain